MDEMPPVYTLSMLADRWSCSERSVRRLVDTRELAGFRLGRKLIRIPRQAVEDYERAQQLAWQGAHLQAPASGSDERLTAAPDRMDPLTRIWMDAIRRRRSD